jgi:hypothetical protein
MGWVGVGKEGGKKKAKTKKELQYKAKQKKNRCLLLLLLLFFCLLASFVGWFRGIETGKTRREGNGT